MIRDNNYKYDGINLFFAKLLHILYLILASSKLGKARERTRKAMDSLYQKSQDVNFPLCIAAAPGL